VSAPPTIPASRHADTAKKLMVRKAINNVLIKTDLDTDRTDVDTEADFITAVDTGADPVADVDTDADLVADDDTGADLVTDVKTGADFVTDVEARAELSADPGSNNTDSEFDPETDPDNKLFIIKN
jgi:hypothetical protein